MIVLLSTSDTDLLSARASGAAYRLGNPARVAAGDIPALLDGATAVVVRILGGRRAWDEGLDAVLAAGVPAVVLGGEQAPDAELMELSTVTAGIVAEAHAYLAHGGPENLRQLARFLSDAITLTGEGFEPPAPMPTWGLLDRTAPAAAGTESAGPWRACARSRHPPDGGHLVLPRASRRGKYRVRARPGGRGAGSRGTGAAGVLLIAADRRARAIRRAAQPRTRSSSPCSRRAG